jgi:hypothetical protein
LGINSGREEDSSSQSLAREAEWKMGKARFRGGKAYVEAALRLSTVAYA